jgi:asparagine synthase (glutamine-hydrolysing)
MLQRIYARTRQILHDVSIPDAVRSVRADSLTYLSDAALCDLYEWVRSIERRSAPGVLIEAGCALGGSAIVIAAAKSPARPLRVYDVFDTIPPPSEKDDADVHERYAVIQSGRSTGLNGNRYYGYERDLLDQVARNFRRHGVAADRNAVHLIRGLFQETLRVEEPVALAHIDGDWYESVMTCLERIEPHLIDGGVMVIDDYDDWSGCRKAVDDFFKDKRDRYEFVRKARLNVVRRS